MKIGLSPRIMLISAMAIFGTISIFIRNIAVASAELALYRSVMAVALIGLYLLISGQKIPFAGIRRELPLLLISGVAIGINWIFLFEAYRYTTVSVATLSYYFAPVLVTVVCPVLFHERLTGKQILCFLMSTLGIVLITGIGKSSGEADLVGILYSLSAAVLYAFVVIINKFIRNVQDIHRTFLQFVAAALVLTPYVLLTCGCSLASLSAAGWGNLLIVGIFHTGISYCLYFSSLKELPGQKAAILSYTDPLVAVLVSVAVLGEPITPLQIVGGGLILGFTLWNEITPKSKKQA